jgi:hypothetical protein
MLDDGVESRRRVLLGKPAALRREGLLLASETHIEIREDRAGATRRPLDSILGNKATQPIKHKTMMIPIPNSISDMTAQPIGKAVVMLGKSRGVNAAPPHCGVTTGAFRRDRILQLWALKQMGTSGSSNCK